MIQATHEEAVKQEAAEWRRGGGRDVRWSGSRGHFRVGHCGFCAQIGAVKSE